MHFTAMHLGVCFTLTFGLAFHVSLGTTALLEIFYERVMFVSIWVMFAIVGAVCHAIGYVKLTKKAQRDISTYFICSLYASVGILIGACVVEHYVGILRIEDVDRNDTFNIYWKYVMEVYLFSACCTVYAGVVTIRHVIKTNDDYLLFLRRFLFDGMLMLLTDGLSHLHDIAARTAGS